MKSLVTGGAGFIGSYLVEELLDKGEQVYIVDNLSTGRVENIRHLLDDSNLSFVVDNVTNKSTMEEIIKNVDQVYHLAAPVGVKYIMENPVMSILDNIRGIDVVLELCNRYRRKILLASSSEVYGKNLEYIRGNGKLSEQDYCVRGSPKNHRWAYANTKALDEFLAFAYYKKYGLPIVIVRLFNIVGPRQTGQYGMVIPRFVQMALKNEPITVYGDGKQTRSFTYITDAIKGLLCLMEEPSAVGDIFNIGTENEISIENLAKKAKKMTQSSSEIVYIPYEEVYGEGFDDMKRRAADIDKIRKLIGFEPQLDIDDILRKVIDYYKDKGKE